MKQKQLTDLNQRWEKIADAYSRGISITELSVHYECSEGLIRKVLISHGVEIRPRGGLKQNNGQSATPARAEVRPKDSAEAPVKMPEPMPVEVRREVQLLPNDYRRPGWRLR